MSDEDMELAPIEVNDEMVYVNRFGDGNEVIIILLQNF
jgi:hypothetical protein